MEKKKILIGIPTYDGKEYCEKEFFDGVDNLIREISFSLSEIHDTHCSFEVMVVDTSNTIDYSKKLLKTHTCIIDKIFWTPTIDDERMGGIICYAFNKIRDYSLLNEFDYTILLESDVIVSGNIEKIIKCIVDNREISTPIIPYIDHTMSLKECEMTEHEIICKPYIKGEIKEDMYIEGASTGCLIIRSDVLERIPFRISPTHIYHFSDIFFSLDAKFLGYNIYCVTDELKHIQEKPFQGIETQKNRRR